MLAAPIAVVHVVAVHRALARRAVRFVVHFGLLQRAVVQKVVARSQFQKAARLVAATH